MIGICGADCSECELFKSKNCQGCKNTNGCPFGKKCWIAKYIEVGGSESFEEQKELLLNGVRLSVEQEDGVYNLLCNEEYLGIGIIQNHLLKRDVIV